nr:uncharacterized protein LOC110372169 isoform X1 [Helicoverpa armigera]
MSSALDDLPSVDSFFGFDLKTGSMIVAALGVVHPMAHGCTFFMPLSYLLVTVWILVALFFAASIVLFWGLSNNNEFLCALWVWYTVVFVAVMLMMMIMLALVFTSRRQRSRVFVVILGMLWYMLTIYFILVVNSHRKTLVNQDNTAQLKAMRKAGQVNSSRVLEAMADQPQFQCSSLAPSMQNRIRGQPMFRPELSFQGRNRTKK